MTSSYWIKLYHEVLDDPKMGRLPDHIWRRAIEFFLIAGETGKGGYLPPVEDLSWRLRASDDDVLSTLEILKSVNIVQLTSDGWLITHFAQRQDAASNARRQERYRDKKRLAHFSDENVTKSNEISNDSLLPRNADKDEDKDEDVDTDTKEIPPPPASNDIFQLYESEIGIITPRIADDLKDIEGSFPKEWIEKAFHEAAINNKRSLAYSMAILKRWKVEGFGTKTNSKPTLDAAREAARLQQQREEEETRRYIEEVSRVGIAV